MIKKNIVVIAAQKNPEALLKKDLLIKKYGFFDILKSQKNIADFDLIVAIGGDGLILHLLHKYQSSGIPIYGINCGTVGFLMNSFCEEDFLKTLQQAKESKLYPLQMTATDYQNKIHVHNAINEVALLRQSNACPLTEFWLLPPQEAPLTIFLPLGQSFLLVPKFLLLRQLALFVHAILKALFCPLAAK